jgi:ATPase family associated with various cellular activities (AAA)
MFEMAIKAHLPIIGCHTDDSVNYGVVLEALTNRKPVPFPWNNTAVLKQDYIYYTEESEKITVDTYKKVVNAGVQLVVVNPEKKSSFVFDAGEMPVPFKLVETVLQKIVPKESVQLIAQSLQGCTIKGAQEIVHLSAAMFGEITPKSIKATRARLTGGSSGLYPLDVDITHWVAPPEITEWMELNAPYMNDKVNYQMMPKGLMLEGPPGTGKSLAARAIAKKFGVSAYRLDVATTLNRYIGESEARIAKSLHVITENAPCVVLIDEVEKAFTKGDDSGTTTRMLGQLLWWLQDRKVPCPVIMTTNKLEVVPPELYRPGRVDAVLHMPELDQNQARIFGLGVFESVIGLAGDSMKKYLLSSTKKKTMWSHAEIHNLAMVYLKKNKMDF